MTTTSVVPITEVIASNMPSMGQLLPADISIDDFRAATWLYLKGHPALGDCTTDSIMDSLVQAATYGMLPGRDCDLLPFKKKGVSQATYVERYKGILRALERTGKVAKGFAHPKHANDHFELDYGMDTFSHRPNIVDPGPVEFYYGCILMKDGTRHVQTCTLDFIESVMLRAPAHDTGPWVSDFNQMARKTALKQVAKYVQLTDAYTQMDEDAERREQTNIPEGRVMAHIADMTRDEGAERIPELEANAAASPEGLEHAERARILQAIKQAREDYGIDLPSFIAWLDAIEAGLGYGLEDGIVKAPLATLRMVLTHLDTHGADTTIVPFDPYAAPEETTP